MSENKVKQATSGPESQGHPLNSTRAESGELDLSAQQTGVLASPETRADALNGETQDFSGSDAIEPAAEAEASTQQLSTVFSHNVMDTQAELGQFAAEIFNISGQENDPDNVLELSSLASLDVFTVLDRANSQKTLEIFHELVRRGLVSPDSVPIDPEVLARGILSGAQLRFLKAYLVERLLRFYAPAQGVFLKPDNAAEGSLFEYEIESEPAKVQGDGSQPTPDFPELRFDRLDDQIRKNVEHVVKLLEALGEAVRSEKAEKAEEYSEWLEEEREKLKDRLDQLRQRFPNIVDSPLLQSAFKITISYFEEMLLAEAAARERF